jgi:hypothetical protein
LHAVLDVATDAVVDQQERESLLLQMRLDEVLQTEEL